MIGFNKAEKLSITDDTVFDRFSQTVTDLPFVQGLKRLGVREYQLGLIKSTDQILACH